MSIPTIGFEDRIWFSSKTYSDIFDTFPLTTIAEVTPNDTSSFTAKEAYAQKPMGIHAMIEMMMFRSALPLLVTPSKDNRNKASPIIPDKIQISHGVLLPSSNVYD